MTRISSEYARIETIHTAKFKFPCNVSVEYKLRRIMFKVIFKEKDGQHFSTKWLWNVGCLNLKNETIIQAKLNRAEDYLDQQLKREIELTMREVRRKQQIEARIERLCERS